MTEDELRQSHEAELYIKEHKSALIKRFADPDVYKPEDHPISLFMAGSPGAGKTETSKRLIERFTNEPVRIDADEIRALFPTYHGSNAYIFQSACTIGVNKLYDHVLERNISAILDGTFAYHNAFTNVQRSIEKGRKVEIFFLYQDPPVAWDFTKKREQLEKRLVSREVFIDSFFAAQKNVMEVKNFFQDKLELNLVIQNLATHEREFRLNRLYVKQVDVLTMVRRVARGRKASVILAI